jgi:pimeloyl-ACP methyl ester carboxylesterase
MPFLEVPDDATLFYTDDGAGPPVLLVHGWTGDSHDWSWQIPALLGAGYRVIAPDLRGHGRSSVPADGYRLKQFAKDIVALLDHLDTGPVVAMGHSLGTIIVSTLAVEHPERVRALVVADPTYGFEPEMAGYLDNLLDALREDPHAAGLENLRTFNHDESTPAHLKTWHTRRMLGTAPHVIRDIVLNLYEPPDAWLMQPQAEVYLAGRNCPVLTLRRDEKYVEWDRSLPDPPPSEVVSLGTDHFPQQQRPEEFNALVLDWLARLPSFNRTETNPWR